MARRASLADVARRFDFTWFLQAMHKYRRLLGEVLIASFFLQLFALVTPLFFQVVTDKVPTHRGFTTLDVLVVGLIAVTVFETILGALRTYVFAHTTSRIDVELGTRLFRHLIALPIAYISQRRDVVIAYERAVAAEIVGIRTAATQLVVARQTRTSSQRSLRPLMDGP
jgi:subfamily B ATP-binding cassette protein HlyB/CyaB